MKILAALAATLVLPVFPAAMAQGFACAGSELSGGTGPAYCTGSSTGSTRIIEVERQAYGHPPSPGSSYVDTYTRSQVQGAAPRHPGYYSHDGYNHDGAAWSHFTRPPSGHETDAATSYGFEWWTSERYYGRTGCPATDCGHYTQPYQGTPSRGFTVQRGGTATTYGAARPCSYHQAQPRVTTSYTGCAGTTTYTAPAPVTTTTTYRAPAPTYVEPAPVYEYQPEPDYGYDEYTPVVSLNSGVCEREIRALRDDREGRKRYEVCYRDLTPIYGGRVEVLYSRIERAAERACDANSFSLRYNRSARDCENQAVDRAVYDTGLEALANYHIAKTGRGRPRVTVGPLQRY